MTFEGRMQCLKSSVPTLTAASDNGFDL